MSKRITDPAHQEVRSLFHQQDLEFDLKQALLEQLEGTGVHPQSSMDIDEGFARFWEKAGRKNRLARPMTKWMWYPMRIAAVLIIGLLSGYLVHTYLGNQNKVLYYTAKCPAGSTSSLVLPDSTLIYLNAGSEVRYSADGVDGVREVFLNGEAWFDVTKIANKPFIVSTPSYGIRVTGTQFNVKAYEGDRYISTTLEEGEVKIISTEDLIFANDLALKPGQQAVYDKERRVMLVKEVKTEWYTSWKDNKLIFVNMNLRELQILLERKYGVDIVIMEEKLYDLHFDGVIKNETIFEIMDILEMTLSIDYHIVDQRIEITTSDMN